MATFFKNIFFSIFILSVFNVDQETIEEHEIEVNHPAFEKGSSNVFVLKEIQIKNKASEFYLEVESVICIDHLCKIVPVRLYWNAYGDYLRYELDKGIRLEKGEGEPFIEDDYQLLHTILLDKKSPYKDISYHEITHEKVVGEGQVDAIAGATETVLQKGETVIGAAWTCFTLWHWANGDIVQEIRRITGGRLTIAQLLGHLKSNAEELQIFALNEMEQRKSFNPMLLEFLVNMAPKASNKINKLVIRYIELASRDVFLEMIGRLYLKGNQENRVLYLNSLSQSKIIGDPEFYDVFTNNIASLKSYQEIDLLLNILVNIKANPYQLEQVSGLLENNNFIMARRAYWFLKNQKMTPVIKIKCSAFYEKNSNRL